MGRIAVAVYRPKPGNEQALLDVVKDHMPALQAEGLVTERKPIIMRASDGAVIEVFEWKSSAAIEAAHKNPAVLKLWERFSAVCDYVSPANVKEFQDLFSEFEPIN